MSEDRQAEDREPLRVAIAGATGLVGRAALAELRARPEVAEVIALVRREGAISAGPRVRELVVDWSRLDELPPSPHQVALCALGTTMARAGSREAFRAVDHDAVLAFARWARRSGAAGFGLVSSVGADPGARNFYLRVKGELEAALGALGFTSVDLLRPSLLLGPREESRPGETIARALAPVLGAVCLGPLRRYRPVRADQVARALVEAGLARSPGTRVLEHAGLRALAAAGRQEEA